jgi:protein-tyrosine phosphatase
VFRVLVVCTANICRSPMMERMLRHQLAERGVGECFEVTSAGTWRHDPEDMHPHSAAVLGEYGVDVSGFRSRELLESLMERSDLVLTAAREHRAVAVSLWPRASRHTFTLLEFARLLGPVHDVPDEDDVEKRAHALVKAAAANRGQVRPGRPDDDDLADPIGRQVADYRITARLVDDALRVFVDRLAPTGTRHLGSTA